MVFEAVPLSARGGGFREFRLTGHFAMFCQKKKFAARAGFRGCYKNSIKRLLLFKLYFASVVLEFCFAVAFCNCCVAIVVLQLQFCSCCFASVVLHLLFCNCCIAIAALQLLFCSCCVAIPVLQSLCWNCSVAIVVLQLV